MSNESNLENILIKEIMAKELILADSTTTVFQIAKIMEQGIGAVLIRKDSLPSGIITDRDFATKIATNKLSFDTPVEKVASYPLQTISQNESILEAAKVMSTKKIRKLAVMGEGKIVGIITSTDIVNKIANI